MVFSSVWAWMCAFAPPFEPSYIVLILSHSSIPARGPGFAAAPLSRLGSGEGPVHHVQGSFLIKGCLDFPGKEFSHWVVIMSHWRGGVFPQPGFSLKLLLSRPNSRGGQGRVRDSQGDPLFQCQGELIGSPEREAKCETKSRRKG